MESFDAKDCEISESFDRKFEMFPSKDAELEEPTSEISESFDGKFEMFPSKDSELDVPPNQLSESFDRKIESFESKDSNNTRSVSRKDSKLDGRSKLRSVKQIEAYKRNFGKADSIELKLGELDVRMRHLQSLVLGVLRGRQN